MTPAGAAAPMPERRPARWFRTALRWAVTLLILVLLARLVNLRRTFEVLLSADLFLLSLGILLGLLDRALMIAKWYPLLRVQAPWIPIGPAARAYLASHTASFVLPTSLGGDILRAFALGRGRGAVAEVGASVAAERALGLAASGVLSLLALLLAWRSGLPLGFLLPWALASAGASLAVLLLPLVDWERTRAGRWTGARLAGARFAWLRRFAAAFGAYRRHPRMLAAVGGLTLIEQFAPVVVLWILARAIGADIGWIMLLVACPLALFLARLPVSASGLGITEGALVYLLGLFGVRPSVALALALAGRIVELAAAVPGAFLWIHLSRSAAAAPSGPAPARHEGAG